MSIAGFQIGEPIGGPAVSMMMGRISHGHPHHPWASRDYAEPIRCRCISCLFHDQRCEDLCGMPSKAVINGAGECEGYIESKQIKPLSI